LGSTAVGSRLASSGSAGWHLDEEITFGALDQEVQADRQEDRCRAAVVGANT
jgi:hypothetical protein